MIVWVVECPPRVEPRELSWRNVSSQRGIPRLGLLDVVIVGIAGAVTRVMLCEGREQVENPPSLLEGGKSDVLSRSEAFCGAT